MQLCNHVDHETSTCPILQSASLTNYFWRNYKRIVVFPFTLVISSTDQDIRYKSTFDSAKIWDFFIRFIYYIIARFCLSQGWFISWHALMNIRLCMQDSSFTSFSKSSDPLFVSWLEVDKFNFSFGFRLIHSNAPPCFNVL